MSNGINADHDDNPTLCRKRLCRPIELKPGSHTLHQPEVENKKIPLLHRFVMWCPHCKSREVVKWAWDEENNKGG